MVAFAKRVLLFVLLNALVLAMMMIVVRVFGLDRALTARGIDYRLLIPFCLVWGMGGALISLMLSRIMAKFAMGVEVIDPNTSDRESRHLLETVHGLAQSAGLTTMPEVGVYDSPEVNAFATGPTRSRALVAVSTGLLRQLDDREVKAVLGHEIGHVANGDMVTMTLIQGVVNAFVLFLSKVLAYVIATAMAGRRDSDERRGPAPVNWLVYSIVEMLLQFALMIPGAMVVCWFSRWREYRADRAGAQLAGRQNMINALESLRRTQDHVNESEGAALQTLKINSKGSGILRLFMSHPPLEARIARLREES